MPAETFSHSAIAHTDLEGAWRALQSPDTWAAVGGVDEVHDPRHDAAGRLLGYRFSVTAAGRRFRGTATTSLLEAPTAMAVDIDSSEMTGRITVRLEETDQSVRVTVTLDARSKGLLSGMFFGVIASAIGNGLPENVDAFAGRLSA